MRGTIIVTERRGSSSGFGTAFQCQSDVKVFLYHKSIIRYYVMSGKFRVISGCSLNPQLLISVIRSTIHKPKTLRIRSVVITLRVKYTG